MASASMTSAPPLSMSLWRLFITDKATLVQPVHTFTLAESVVFTDSTRG